MSRLRRNAILIEAIGGDIYTYINALREAGCRLRSQTVKNGVFIAKIAPNHYFIAASLATAQGVKLTIRRREGLLWRLAPYRLRLGLIIGFLLGLGIIFCISNTVTVIEINGCETIPRSEIMSGLEDCGIKRGAYIPSLNLRSCRRKMCLRIEELARIGIRRNGCRIVVEVTEAQESPKTIDKSLPCNISSAYEAVVTSVNALAGHAKVKVGDTVAIGDVLISGVCVTKKGNTYLCHSMGSVVGQYTQTIVLRQPLEENITSETGAVVERKTLSAFGVSIPLYIDKEPFSSYARCAEDCPLMLFGGTLPISVCLEEYRETQTTLEVFSVEQAKELLAVKRLRYEEQFCNGVTILNASETFAEEENAVTLTIVYELEGELGVPTELYIKSEQIY